MISVANKSASFLILPLFLLQSFSTLAAVNADRGLSSQLLCREEDSKFKACRTEFLARSERKNFVAGDKNSDERFATIDDLDELRKFCFELAHSYTTCQTQGIAPDEYESEFMKKVFSLFLFGLFAAAMGWIQGRFRSKKYVIERFFAGGSMKISEFEAAAAGSLDSQKYCTTQQQHGNDILRQISPQPLSLGNTSSDSYDEKSEAEDEFLELPIRFRSLGELKSDDDHDQAENHDSKVDIIERKIQERDLRHADELKRHAKELESLYKLFEESTQRYNAKIHSMERRFRDESQKREGILEQALTYAEQLEAKNVRKDKDLRELKQQICLNSNNSRWPTYLKLRPSKSNLKRKAKNPTI